MGVKVAVDGGVMTLTFARPDKKNAITDAMYGALADAMEAAASDPAVRVMLFESEGDAFTAGNDLMDFAAHNADGGTGQRHVGRFLQALATADKPLVAAVAGRAVGIGVTLLLHCDLVYVAKAALLSAPFVNLAVVPEAASSLLMPARIGYTRAYALFALGETIDGETAAAWGLATEALDAVEVRGKARAAAEALARKPAGALAATKRLMRDPAALTERIALETRHFQERLLTAEAREAFRAFFERREPDFTRSD